MASFILFSLLALGLSVTTHGKRFMSPSQPLIEVDLGHLDGLQDRSLRLHPRDVDVFPNTGADSITLEELGLNALPLPGAGQLQEPPLLPGGMGGSLEFPPGLSNSNDEEPDSPASSARRKYVFMHHDWVDGLLWWTDTYQYTPDAWLSDFERMESCGIDAVALNVGGDQWQFDQQLNFAYEAAAKTSVRVFISFDFTAFPCDVAQTIRYINNFQDHPAQFRYAGKPMISSYSGTCLGVDGWKEVRSKTGGYLMPFTYEQDYQDLRKDMTWGFLDSWYCWGCAWPQGNYSKNTADDHYYMDILGKRYATTISGWIYTHYDYKNFYLRGEDWLLATRWEQLFDLRDQLTFVEMITWNDFGESDYFGPLTAGLQPEGTTWATNFPHDAWLDMSQYYIEAFKTGSWPIVTENEVYFWCRPHPAAANALNDRLTKPTGWDWASDALWAIVFCTARCDVELWMGSRHQMYPGLPTGVSKIKMDLGSDDEGFIGVRMYLSITTPSFEVERIQVAEHSTQGSFEYSQFPEMYNYNVYVGKAMASGLS
ncbi:hypothetical protein D9758_014254 [Tetrapyrgos nigripes]|uniref:Glycoside hydrolase family 71 protein n=1 Tax=Tetrapyrgos nigripes TaxID=182062 RepID=A0A8H5FIH9_9AGAR|nr:hypothetical protein D9758_014254 [Tetrapyrgos nigripes]